MLRVMTFNLNGIRSAARKGFFHWLALQNVDVICFQELKAQQIDLEKLDFLPEGYTGFYHCAEKKGYSGVAILTRLPVCDVKLGLGWPDADTEGRYVEVDFGKIKIASLYMPSGTAGEHRQAIKFDFLKHYRAHLLERHAAQESLIICGDLNMAHRQIDLKNWRSNQKNSGFLPEERAWMDDLLGDMGFVDAFRKIDHRAEQYTWWSHRGDARAKNVGWRIDYQIVTSNLKDTIKTANIFPEPFFSDHAPLLVEYNIDMV